MNGKLMFAVEVKECLANWVWAGKWDRAAFKSSEVEAWVAVTRTLRHGTGNWFSFFFFFGAQPPDRKRLCLAAIGVLQFLNPTAFTASQSTVELWAKVEFILVCCFTEICHPANLPSFHQCILSSVFISFLHPLPKLPSYTKPSTIHPSIYPSIYPPALLSIHPSILLFIHPITLQSVLSSIIPPFIYQFIYPPIFLSIIYLSFSSIHQSTIPAIHLPITNSFIYLSFRQPMLLFIYLPVFQYFWLSIHPSFLHLFVHPPVFHRSAH